MRQIALAMWPVVFVLLVASLCPGQTTTRVYKHDSLGNRSSATNLIRFTSSAAFGFEPRRAFTGDRVNIYGRNFPAGVNKDAVVKFGTLTGKTLFVGERVITVEVPANITSGNVTLSVKGGPVMQVGKLSVQGVIVTPSVVELDYDKTQQFTAKVIGGTTSSVTWSVSDLQGGTTNLGTISATGLYKAPALSRSAEFPFLVKASNASIRVTGYALVKLKPHKLGKIGNRVFVSGSFTRANERHAYEFSGTKGQYAFAAFLSDTSAVRVTLRDANGVALASSGAGKELKIRDTQLPETETYRIEIQASSSSTYRVWLDLHSRLPRGRWLFPSSGAWEDDGNWSQGVVPFVGDDVLIPRLSGVTVTLGQGDHRCESVVSDVDVVLAGGQLEVEKTLLVHGRFRLAGASLVGATVLPGLGGHPLVISGKSGLRRISLARETNIESAATVTVQDGLTLVGSRVNLRSGRLVFPGPAHQTLGGKGEVRFIGTTRSYVDTGPSGVLTLGKDVVIRGGNGGIGSHSEATFVNEGTITLGIPGRSLVLNGKNWTNRGTIELASTGSIVLIGTKWNNVGKILVTGGGTLTTGGVNWVNAGLISSTASSLVLGGSFKLDPAGAFVRRGGFVDLIGSLDNTGRKLMFGAGESWNVRKGAITGGSIEGAEALVFIGSGALHGVTLKAPIRVVGGNQVTITKGLTLQSSINLNHGHLRFSGTQSLTGSGTVAFRSTTNSSLFASTGETLTIGAGISVIGGSGFVGATDATFVNRGEIRLVPNRTIELRGQDWVNRGRVVGSPGGSLKATGVSWENQGTILLSGAGTLSLAGTNWTNGGTITVEGAGVMTTSGTKWTNARDMIIRAGASATLGGTGWANSGRISMTTAVLQLAGSFKFGTGSTFLRQGGTVVLTGTLDNAGRTLAFGQVADTWLVRGGGITGGTVTGGVGLVFEKGAALDAVTMNAPFRVINGSIVTVRNNLTLNNTASLNHGELAFTGNASLRGLGKVEFLGAASSYVHAADKGGSLTIDRGITVIGGNGSIGKRTDVPFTLLGTAKIAAPGRRMSFVGASWVNQGTIEATGGGSLALNGSDYVNRGTISITGGGTLGFGGTWRNEGPITMTTSTVNFSGSRFSLLPTGSFTRRGGFVNLSGVLDNTGRTLTFSSAQDEWSVLKGGGVLGGTVAGGEGLIFTASGTLENVNMKAPFRVVNGSAVTITKGLALDARCTLNHGSLVFPGTQSLTTTNKKGEVFFAGASRSYVHADSKNTLTIGTGVRIHGGNGAVGRPTDARFVNRGTIDSTSSGRSIVLIGTAWSSAGVLSAKNNGVLVARGTGATNAPLTWSDGTLRIEGTLSVSGKFTQTGGVTDLAKSGSLVATGDAEITGGTLAGVGTVQTSRLINKATIAPGGVGAIGALTVKGPFLQASTGTLLIEIDKTKTFDSIAISGSVQLAGSLCVKLMNQAQLALNDQFKVMTYAPPLPTGKLTLTCDKPGIGLKWGPKYAANNLTLTVTK
jgi:hypothetical protein